MPESTRSVDAEWRWLLPILLALVIAAALACPHGNVAVERPSGGDAGPPVDGGEAEEPGLEIGDGGLSLGDPGLAMFMGGPRHRGRASHEGPRRAPTVAWSFPTGARIFASPVIGPDGTLYIGSVDGTFNALSAEGELRWSYTASAPIFSTAAISSAGHIYIGCDDGTFLAFHPSGRVLWSERREHPFDSSPVIGDDGTIYVGGAGLIAFTPRGGRRWRVRTGGHVFSPPVVHPRRLIVFGTAEGVVQGTSDDGEALFRQELSGAVNGGAMILETGDIVVGSEGGEVVLLDRSGERRWLTQLEGGTRSTPALGLDGNIYVSTLRGRVVALDAQTGEIRWQFQTGGALRASPLVDRRGWIYIGSQDRNVYCLDPEGELQWQLRLGGQIDSTGAIGADGTYFTGCDDGRVYALRD